VNRSLRSPVDFLYHFCYSRGPSSRLVATIEYGTEWNMRFLTLPAFPIALPLH